jgi:hypothetical protein
MDSQDDDFDENNIIHIVGKGGRVSFEIILLGRERVSFFDPKK